MNFLAIAALCMVPAADLPDGSLVALRDSNVIVKKYTNSSWTHIGIILKIAGRDWVFQSTLGGVNKVPLDEFISRATRSSFFGHAKIPLVYLRLPSKPFPPDELLAMKRFANLQLGRRYSVKGVLRGRPVEGMNCAQFVAATLQQTGRVRFSQTYTQTPSSVLEHTRSLYAEMLPVRIIGERPKTDWIESAKRTIRGSRDLFKWSSWEAFHYWRD